MENPQILTKLLSNKKLVKLQKIHNRAPLKAYNDPLYLARLINRELYKKKTNFNL